MRQNHLQFGKAMGAALFVLLLVVVGTKNALAQTLVATLKHGDNISFYYGANALVDAHNAAETGDIITLSSGSFVPTTITKAITLRGAGCVEDTISGVHPTVIAGNILFNIANSTADEYLMVEGIYFSGEALHSTLNYPKFIKCNFNDFDQQNNVSMNNAQFINCMFYKFQFICTTNTTLINCAVRNAEGLNYANRTVVAYNSYIGLASFPYAMNAYNCIFARYDVGSYQLSSYSVAYNCVGIKNQYQGTGMFNCSNYNCMEVDNFSDIFETFAGGFSYEEAFILKEEIATGFLGDDGTEVGIHGGAIPYAPRPSYQIVRHYSVPNKSDNEGHLNVEIEVYTEEGE